MLQTVNQSPDYCKSFKGFNYSPVALGGVFQVVPPSCSPQSGVHDKRRPKQLSVHFRGHCLSWVYRSSCWERCMALRENGNCFTHKLFNASKLEGVVLDVLRSGFTNSSVLIIRLLIQSVKCIYTVYIEILIRWEPNHQPHVHLPGNRNVEHKFKAHL